MKDINSFKELQTNLFMKGIRFDSKRISLDNEFFINSELPFCPESKTIEQSVFNVYEALTKKYFIKKEARIGTKLVGEIAHINTDLNLNPSLYYYPIFWEREEKTYRIGKEIKLEVRDKIKWIKFILDKESREFYGGFGLTLPNKYFLEKQTKD